MIMHTLPAYGPREHALAVTDRVDRLLLGRGLAARHRTLRLRNRKAAAAFRAAAYAGGIAEADFTPPGKPSAHPRRARAAVAKLLG